MEKPDLNQFWEYVRNNCLKKIQDTKKIEIYKENFI